MPSPPGSDEIVKTLVTAVVTAAISRLPGLFEVLTDPRSPQRSAESAKRTLANMDAASKVLVQLNQLPQSHWRDQMETRIDDLLEKMESCERQGLDDAVRKRERMLRVLSLLRLNMPQSAIKGFLSFLLYVTLVLTIQSIHLYYWRPPFNGLTVWILSGISVLLWVVSGSKILRTTTEKPRESVPQSPIPAP
jgi:hypothetical protein